MPSGRFPSSILLLGLSAALLATQGCSGPVNTRTCTMDSQCASGMCVEGSCAVEGGDGGEPDGGELRDAGSRPLLDARVDAETEVCGNSTVPYDGFQQLITIPNGVRFLHIKAWGSGGNGNGRCRASRDDPDEEGGPGGFSEGVFAVAPGLEYSIVVGRPGSEGADDLGQQFGFGSSGGGGLSGVFVGTETVTETDWDRALVIAGGGGSAAPRMCDHGGPGNHGGAGGQPTMYGEDSADNVGGGGGYRGGNSGTLDRASRGGVGFVSETAEQERVLNAEIGSPDPPAIDDPDYDGRAGTTEVSGRVVILFLCERPPPLI